MKYIFYLFSLDETEEKEKTNTSLCMCIFCINFRMSAMQYRDAIAATRLSSSLAFSWLMAYNVRFITGLKSFEYV